MRKYTQKQLREMVAYKMAENISNYSFEQMSNFISDKNLNQVGYSAGVYGANGALLQDIDTGTLYAIIGRSTALFMAI